MSKRRTPEEVAAEIAALEKLVPVGRFARKTADTIAIQVDALKGNIDETADEFTVELSDELQMSAMDAINWANGDGNEQPSLGLGELVK